MPTILPGQTIALSRAQARALVASTSGAAVNAGLGQALFSWYRNIKNSGILDRLNLTFAVKPALAVTFQTDTPVNEGGYTLPVGTTAIVGPNSKDFTISGGKLFKAAAGALPNSPYVFTCNDADSTKLSVTAGGSGWDIASQGEWDNIGAWWHALTMREGSDVVGSLPAWNLLRATNQPADASTVALNGRTYIFKTNIGATDGHVKIGATLLETMTNLRDAINNAGTTATYYTATANAHMTAALYSQPEWGNTVGLRVTSLLTGAASNAYTFGNSFLIGQSGGARAMANLATLEGKSLVLRDDLEIALHITGATGGPMRRMINNTSPITVRSHNPLRKARIVDNLGITVSHLILQDLKLFWSGIPGVSSISLDPAVGYQMKAFTLKGCEVYCGPATDKRANCRNGLYGSNLANNPTNQFTYKGGAGVGVSSSYVNGVTVDGNTFYYATTATNLGVTPSSGSTYKTDGPVVTNNTLYMYWAIGYQVSGSGAPNPYTFTNNRAIWPMGFGGSELSGTTTNGSVTITSANSARVVEGAPITGTGIPAGTYVQAVATDGLSFTITQAATASGTVTLTLPSDTGGAHADAALVTGNNGQTADMPVNASNNTFVHGGSRGTQGPLSLRDLNNAGTKYFVPTIERNFLAFGPSAGAEAIGVENTRDGKIRYNSAVGPGSLQVSGLNIQTGTATSITTGTTVIQGNVGGGVSTTTGASLTDNKTQVYPQDNAAMFKGANLSGYKGNKWIPETFADAILAFSPIEYGPAMRPDGTYHSALLPDGSRNNGQMYSVPILPIGGTWTGPANSGFTSVPDPVASAAARAVDLSKPRPAVNIMSQPDVIMLNDYTLLISAELWDENGNDLLAGVRVMYEGAELILTARGKHTYTTATGRTETFEGFIVRLAKPSTNLTVAPSAGSRANFYIEAIPKDEVTYDRNLIGPFGLFPRNASDVVTKRIHKTAGKGDVLTIEALHNSAIAEFIATGKPVVGKISQEGQDWNMGTGQGTNSTAVPWFTMIERGTDTDTGNPVINATLGDAAVVFQSPSRGYSSFALNRVGFVGLKADQGKFGAILPKSAAHCDIAFIDCDIFCSSFPATANIFVGSTLTAYPQYGTGTGAAALVRGRLSGAWWSPGTAVRSTKMMLMDCHLHDLPGYGATSLWLDRNNHIRDVSGTARESPYGGVYGGTASRFSGYYSGLRTDPESPNPGMSLSYIGNQAWWGFRRTTNTGGAGKFQLYHGATQAAAISAGPVNTFTTALNKSVADLATEINGTTNFRATDLTTDAYRLDCTHLSLPSLAPASPIQQDPALNGGTTGIPVAGQMSVGNKTSILNVIVDIHGNGIASVNGMLGGTPIKAVNITIVNVKHYEYCLAGSISGASDSGVGGSYDDYWVRGCEWYDDKGYFDRRGVWREVIVEMGYCTGAHDGWGIVYSTFANGAGFNLVGTTPLLNTNSVIANVYGRVGTLPSSGLKASGIVSPNNAVPVGATNTKTLSGNSNNIDPWLSFRGPQGPYYDLAPRDATTHVILPDGKIAGARSFDGSYQIGRGKTPTYPAYTGAKPSGSGPRWLNTAFRQTLTGDASWGTDLIDPQDTVNGTSTVINNLEVYPVLSSDGVYMHGKAGAVSGQAANATKLNAGNNPLLAGHSYLNSASSPAYSRQLPPGTYDMRLAIGQSSSAGSETAIAVFEGLYDNLGFGVTVSTIRHWAASTEYAGSFAIISSIDGSTWSKTSTTATTGTVQPSGAGPTFVDGGITWTRLPRTALLVIRGTTPNAGYVVDQNNRVVPANTWADQPPVPITVTGSPTYGAGICLVRFGGSPFPYIRTVGFKLRSEPLQDARLVNDLGVEQGANPTIYAGQPEGHLGFKIITSSGQSGVSNISLSGDLAPYFTPVMSGGFTWLAHNGTRIPDALAGSGRTLVISQLDTTISAEPYFTEFACDVVSSQGRPTSGVLGSITTQNYLNRKTVMDKVEALWPGYEGQAFAQDLLATSVADFTTKLSGLTPDGTSWYRIRLAAGSYYSTGSNSNSIAKNFGTGGLLIEPATGADPDINMAFTGLRMHGLHMRNLLLSCDFNNGTTGLYHWRFQDTGLTGINGSGKSNKVKISNCRVGYRHLPGALASEWQTRRAFPFTMLQGESMEVVDCQFFGTATAHGYTGVRVVNLARNDYRSVPYDIHAINNASDWESTQGVLPDDNIYVNISDCTLRDEVDYTGYTQTGHLDWIQIRNWGNNTSFWYPSNVEDNLAIGEYSNAVAYAKGKRVFYNGQVYLSILDTTAGTLPTNTTYWTYGGWRIGQRALNMVGTPKAVYEVVGYTTGISAAGNGPEGHGQAIVDGGVIWKWLADYTTNSDTYLNIENNVVNASKLYANGPDRQCFIDSNGGHDCAIYTSYNNNFYGGASSYGITDVSPGELHAEYNTFAAPSNIYSTTTISGAQLKKNFGNLRSRHNITRNLSVGMRTSIEDETVLNWTSAAVSPNRPVDIFNGPLELDPSNKWSYPTLLQSGTAEQFAENMKSILTPKVGTAGAKRVLLPTDLTIRLGALTPRGFGGHDLGYTGTGTLSITSDPSGLFAIDGDKKLVLAGTYAAVPPVGLTGSRTLTISCSEGRTQKLTVNFVAGRYDITNKSTDTEASNQLRAAIRDEVSVKVPGQVFMLRPRTVFNGDRTGTGIGNTWTFRQPTNAGMAAVMTGGVKNVADNQFAQFTCEIPGEATIGGLQLDGTNQRIHGLWFKGIKFRHMYAGVARPSGALLQFGTSINSSCSYVRVSNCTFQSNDNYEGQRAQNELISGTVGATGTREIHIHDNTYDGLYDGVNITGNLSSTGQQSEATNIWLIGNTFSNIWNDCRKFIEAAPVYSRFNFAFNKRYGSGSLHGDFEQRLFNDALAGTYDWGDFIGNIMVRAEGTATWKEAQGIFQTAGTANAVNFTNAKIEGNIYHGTFVRAISIAKCTAPRIRFNTVIRDLTTGIVNDTVPGSTTIYLGDSTLADVRYNASFNGVVTEGTVTFAANSQNVTTAQAAYAAAYLSATTIGSSLKSIEGVLAALSMKPGGPLDKAVTGYANHVGAAGTGYIDYVARTTTFPAP